MRKGQMEAALTAALNEAGVDGTTIPAPPPTIVRKTKTERKKPVIVDGDAKDAKKRGAKKPIKETPSVSEPAVPKFSVQKVVEPPVPETPPVEEKPVETPAPVAPPVRRVPPMRRISRPIEVRDEPESDESKTRNASKEREYELLDRIAVSLLQLGNDLGEYLSLKRGERK